MRDRQPVGNVAQQEVIEATCSSAQVPTVAIIAPGYTPEPVGIINPTFYPAPSPGINNIPQQTQPAGKINKLLFFLLKITFFLASSSVLAYQPCVPSNEWYASPPTIRCSSSFAATGFTPDPKDCSKYYACDPYVGSDGMSTGEINKIKSRQLYIHIYMNRYFNAMFGWFVVGSTTTYMCTSI